MKYKQHIGPPVSKGFVNVVATDCIRRRPAFCKSVSVSVAAAGLSSAALYSCM